mmetsp:Transcript_21029/g.29443  ORF Transcript_21029/g.29443 Transcript_21029/m.29443 type:complete len:86 (-) Transcript_21029:115-372(-)
MVGILVVKWDTVDIRSSSSISSSSINNSNGRGNKPCKGMVSNTEDKPISIFSSRRMGNHKNRHPTQLTHFFEAFYKLIGIATLEV